MELKIVLTAKQKLFYQTVESTRETFYGGGKGSGKSKAKRDVMLLRRFKYPGSIGYIFRKTYAELERNHITPLLQEYPELEPFYEKGTKTLHLPNKSKLRFAYIEHGGQLNKFQGLDGQDLGIEEAGEWPYEHYEYLKTQFRSSKPGMSTRILLTGNPGGVGHTWLKRLFVTRKYNANENPADYAFIPATVEDNPFIMKNDPEYVKRLESMQNETLRKAFRYGDWNITAGQYFDMLDRNIHLVKPFAIPAHWKRQLVYDWGYGHPAGFQLWAANEMEEHFCYWSWYKAKTQIEEQAAVLKAHPDFHKFKNGVIAGRDCWAKRFGFNSTQDGGPTVAELFLREGIVLRPANTDRVHGANLARIVLSHKMAVDKDGKEFREGPEAFFFNEIDFDCLTRMTHDPDNIEDVLKVDAENGDPWTGDEPYDLFRYYFMDRPRKSLEAPKDPIKDMYLRRRQTMNRPDAWTA